MMHDSPNLPAFVMPTADAGLFRITVKAVPGASRDQIVGPLGTALKVRVAAPPEGGKANAAITRLLAECMGVRPSCIRLVRGGSHSEKVFEVECSLQDFAGLRSS